MEVIAHDVKTEYIVSSDLTNNSDCETQRLSVSPNPASHQHQQNHQYSSSPRHNSGGSVGGSGSSSKSNTVLNHHLTSGGGILTSGPSSTSSSVRNSGTTVSGGQNLQTMAKSSGLSIVHVTLPQTVIQSPSVIQSASGQLQLSKGNVILVSSSATKQSNSSVIQTAGGGLQSVQIIDTHHSDESLSNDGVEHPIPTGTSSSGGGRNVDRRRREILTRRPSYRKILSDLGGAEIAGGDKGDLSTTDESSQDAADGGRIVIGEYPNSMVKVINANALGLSGVTSADASGVGGTALQTITMTNAGTAGGTIVQYAQSQDGQQFFVPVGAELQAYTLRPVSSASSSPSVVLGGGGGHHVPEEATRKREIRLLKNREAARECRRKKKEYIKCLENRVAVLENQNKALIDELKSLKELYCQKNE